VLSFIWIAWEKRKKRVLPSFLRVALRSFIKSQRQRTDEARPAKPARPLARPQQSRKRAFSGSTEGASKRKALSSSRSSPSLRDLVRRLSRESLSQPQRGVLSLLALLARDADGFPRRHRRLRTVYRERENQPTRQPAREATLSLSPFLRIGQAAMAAAEVGSASQERLSPRDQCSEGRRR